MSSDHYPASYCCLLERFQRFCACLRKGTRKRSREGEGGAARPLVAPNTGLQKAPRRDGRPEQFYQHVLCATRQPQGKDQQRQRKGVAERRGVEFCAQYSLFSAHLAYPMEGAWRHVARTSRRLSLRDQVVLPLAAKPVLWVTGLGMNMERNCDAHHARDRGLNGSLRVVGAHNSSPSATLGLLVSASAPCICPRLLLVPNWISQGKSGQRRPPSPGFD